MADTSYPGKVLVSVMSVMMMFESSPVMSLDEVTARDGTGSAVKCAVCTRRESFELPECRCVAKRESHELLEHKANDQSLLCIREQVSVWPLRTFWIDAAQSYDACMPMPMLGVSWCKRDLTTLAARYMQCKCLQ